jgi:polysaccharide biosynthesis transport protein
MIDSSEVKLHFLDYWRVIRMRAGLITLVFLLVMITAGVTTYFMPREYEAKVTMEVRPDNYKMVDFFGGSVNRTYDPQFVATQFQILRKTEILYPVIQQLDLIKTFSGDGPKMPLQQVFNALVGSLDLNEVRNTGLIEIGVYNTNAELAANIANTIAVQYRNRRFEDLQQALDKALSQFKDEVETQRDVVLKAAQKAATLRQELGIIDPDPENGNVPINVDERKVGTIESAVNEQQTKVETIRTELNRIEALKPEQLMEALHILKIDNATVNKNLPLLQDYRAERERLLKTGLGENHRRIKELDVTIDSYRKNLDDELGAIRRAQAIELQVAQETLKALQDSLKANTTVAIQTKSNGSDYVKAKTDYLEGKRILEAAEMQYATERMKQKIEIDPAKIWERAEPPMGWSKPPVRTYMAVAVIIGLILGIGLAFFIEYLDTSVKTIEDVERFLQIPVLAVVPRGIPILMRLKADHPDAEAYRILRANIEFNKPSPDAKTMTLISGGPGEGKSTTLNNLAFTCAKGGYNVLVVDADLRRPSQHILFATDNDRGLSDFLSGKASLDSITRTTNIDNLSFISSGQFPDDNVGLLNSQRMTDLIHRVKSQYDLVFFDSPPILGVSDGSVLTSEMDMTVMVVQHRRFPRAMLQRVKQAVNQVGGALVGVVLNNVDKKHDEGYAYYNAYNEYYNVPKPRAARPAAEVAPQAPAPRRPAAVTPIAPKNGEY